MNPRIQFVLNYFRKLYGVPEEIEIGYGSQDCKVNITQSQTTYFNLLQSYDAKKVIWKKWKNRDIPILFGQNENEAILSENQGRIHIQDDILLSAFFFLSGWQEYVYQYHHPTRLYPCTESLQARLGIIQEPVVQSYFDILKTAIEKAYSISLQLPKWNDKPYALCLTHDVDRCQVGWIEDGFHALKQGKVNQSFQIVRQRLRGQDTWFNFQHILDIERSRKAHSTFFFMATKKQSGVESADYHLSHPSIQSTMAAIQNAGSEVGIHGSADNAMNPEKFQRELEQFHHPVIGNRFHYLSFHNPQTLSILESSGIQYDATLGFTEEIGFRNGTAWPFPLFDCQRNQVTSVIEIPLIIMDATLRKNRHEHPSDVFPKIQALMNRIKEVNGCCTILWHNNYFSEYKFQGWSALYQQILEYAKDEAWLASGEEVYRTCQFLVS